MKLWSAGWEKQMFTANLLQTVTCGLWTSDRDVVSKSSIGYRHLRMQRSCRNNLCWRHGCHALNDPLSGALILSSTSTYKPSKQCLEINQSINQSIIIIIIRTLGWWRPVVPIWFARNVHIRLQKCHSWQMEAAEPLAIWYSHVGLGHPGGLLQPDVRRISVGRA